MVDGQSLISPSIVNSSQCCVLCGANRRLEQSHIIPQFVYRWANEVSGSDERQVGRTRPMLCGRCEDRFSFYESEFARRVFHPLTANSFQATKYDGWLRKFAASVCWRILEERAATNPSEPFGGRWMAERESCRATWRSFLMDKRPDVAGHSLYFLPVAAVLNGAGLASSMPKREASSRLSLRAVDSHVICDESAAFVYAKLGSIILIGLIAEATPSQWRGTRINAEGKLKRRDLFAAEPCL